MAVGSGSGPQAAPTSWTRSGDRWHRVPIPRLPSRQRQININEYDQRYVGMGWDLTSLSCASARSCVAVGVGTSQGPDRQHPPRPLIERWDGRRWRRETPAQRYGGLTSVSCPSAGACLAVGETDSNENAYIARPELLQDGHWTARELPAITRAYVDEIGSVSCSSSIRCVGVGLAKIHSTGGLPRFQGVVAVWDGSAWTPSLLALMPGDGGEVLSDVSCPPGARTTCVVMGTRGNRYAGPGARMVPVIPAAGAPLSAARTLPFRGDDGLDCPNADLCVAGGLRYPLRAED